MARATPTAAVPDTTDPADLGVLEAAAALRARRVSARELLDAVLARIAERNGGEPTFDGAPDAVNAWARIYPGEAATMAHAADERRAREGDDAPLLCGVPIGVKDLYAVAGLPVTASSRMLEGNVATEDCVAWARLRAAGMVLVGHTHTHEFAFGGTTDQVGNPWALERSAGGSSGGSAAALAARMVPATTGTDTAGSVRIPAAMCGISSIKPTHGRVPIRGIVPLAETLDHAGPMARSVADCGALLDAMAAGGAETSALMPPPAPLPPMPLAATPGARPFAGRTIAVLGDPPRMTLDPDVAEGLEGAAAACERLGARVIRAERSVEVSLRAWALVASVDFWSFHEQFDGREAEYREFLRPIVAAVRSAGPAAAYARIQSQRTTLAGAWEDWMASAGVDLLLEATIPTPAPPRTLGYAPELPNPDPHILLTYPWNMTGFPVAALPAGVGARSGLPVGVSFIGRRGGEADVAQAGIDLQEHALAPPVAPAPGQVTP
jgi:aspartyl-tRNA(Asn)/glutamyl-tRNA(Gln) amidotransferase subunit A